MSIDQLDFTDPFFGVTYIADESCYSTDKKSIVLNLSDEPITIESQSLSFLQSCVVINASLQHVKCAVTIDRFDEHDEAELFDAVRSHWPLAYDVRKEERLRGVSHYMGPKIHIGNVGLGLYHAGSVPLNVGLHKEHPWCEKPGFKEVHTQIVGFGKMQQCREKDINTLYLEEPMSPGTTHRPMYDGEGNYPWHQYETVTPGIFMAVEILPE